MVSYASTNTSLQYMFNTSTYLCSLFTAVKHWNFSISYCIFDYLSQNLQVHVCISYITIINDSVKNSEASYVLTYIEVVVITVGTNGRVGENYLLQ